MPIITDSVFIKGSSHHICQDYAIHGDNHAIGSDGCSSSPHTDVGSRILCNTLSEKLKECGANTEVLRYAAYDAALCADKLGLPNECLDATLFGFHILEGQVISFISGDGYIYKRFRAGGKLSEELRAISFEPNMPFYPNYYTNLRRLKSHNETGVKATLKVDYPSSDLPSFSHTWEADEFCRYESDALGDLELLLMFSDGLGTFQLDKKDIEVNKVLESLTNIKSYSPGFLQRKVINGMKKDFVGTLTHWDDFSVVGLINV